MSCINSIIKDITSNCSTSGIGGLEINAWLVKRNDVTLTWSTTSGKENIITDITNKATKKGIKITGIKKLLKATFTAVTAENRPNKFTHTFSFEIFEKLGADYLNMDQPDDVIAIVELKDKTTTGEGVFRVLGAKNGLYTSADAEDTSASNGARVITLSSMANQEEPYSAEILFDTDYATTAAIASELTTTGV